MARLCSLPSSEKSSKNITAHTPLLAAVLEVEILVAPGFEARVFVITKRCKRAFCRL
jgi:hypothetical protein